MAAHKAGERDEAKQSQLALQRSMKRRDFAAGRQELLRPLIGRGAFPYGRNRRCCAEQIIRYRDDA